MLLYCCNVILLFYCVVVFVYCRVDVLSYCCNIILLFCHVVVFVYCRVDVQYCHIVVMLYCCLVVLSSQLKKQQYDVVGGVGGLRRIYISVIL